MAPKDDYNSLSYDEKLKIIDKEIEELNKFCQTEGFDRYTIEACAKPLLDMAKRPRRMRYTKWLVFLTSVAVAMFAVVYVLPEYKLFWVLSRILAIKMIPIFDWTDVINWDCLIDNPYFESVPYNEENCKICDSMDGIPRFSMSEVSPDVIAEDYLKMNRPFILTDAMKDWPASKKFTVPFLQKLYTENPTLNKAEACSLTGNFKVKSSDPKSILEKLITKKAKGYTLRWNNCNEEAAKQLRPQYKRPAAIPPMVEMNPSNWVMVSSYYTQDNDLALSMGDTMGLYAQVKGEAAFTLLANEPCDETCPELTTTLKEGEMVIWTDLMWEASYSPSPNPENIAIATTGTFDY